MGRPINKRYLNDEVKALRAVVKIGSNDQEDAWVIGQRSSKVFTVKDMVGNVGDCKLVSKTRGEQLADDEMAIYLNDIGGDNEEHNVVKLAANKATLSNGRTIIWFDPDSIGGR